MVKLENVFGYSAFGASTFGVASYMLKTHIEYPLNQGGYPEVDLSDVFVSIHMCSLNEEYFIEDTLKDIVTQPLYQQFHPSNIELVLIDSHSEDQTREIAKSYVDRIIETPQGKLTSRRIGLEETPNADIIVSVDADTHYPLGYMNFLLPPFSDKNVVAVAGSCLPLKRTVNPFVYVGMLWYNLVVQPRLLGRNSAFRRDAFTELDGWNEEIDQTNVQAMIREEEINFYKRMTKIGTVIKELHAVCYEIPRRFMCHTDAKTLAMYCEMIKTGERF